MTDSDPAVQAGPENESAEQVAPPTERVEGLEASLSAAEAKAKEYLDGWQRERAAFANYRRRSDEGRSSASRTATEDLVCKLLPLLDDLDRACGEVPADAAGHSWVQGVTLVQRKFHQLLASLGVEQIEAEGCKFDPGIHEAITHEESDGFEEGDVIDEVTKGYRMGDRVLRCSVVRVAKAS